MSQITLFAVPGGIFHRIALPLMPQKGSNPVFGIKLQRLFYHIDQPDVKDIALAPLSARKTRAAHRAVNYQYFSVGLQKLYRVIPCERQTKISPFSRPDSAALPRQTQCCVRDN